MAATIDHLTTDHQVIAPTHPGWVGTQRAASLNAVGALARAYLDLLAGDGARDVVVVGASFGAWTAAQMAIDDYQGRIGALVLIGPIGARVPAQALCLPTTPGARGGRGPRVVQPAALRAYVGPAAHDPSLITRLGAAHVPALVIRGSEDQMTSPVQARAWAGALGCDLVATTGGGHLPCHRAPAATFAAIDALLSPPLALTAWERAPRRGAAKPGSPAAMTTTFPPVKEVAMHLATDPTGHRVPQTDAEIDAAVHAFIAELTGTRPPVGPAARRYEHAMETITEEVTELLASLDNHR